MKKLFYLLLLFAGILTLGYTGFFGLLMASGLGSNWGSSQIPPEGWALLIVMTMLGIAFVLSGWKGLTKKSPSDSAAHQVNKK